VGSGVIVRMSLIERRRRDRRVRRPRCAAAFLTTLDCIDDRVSGLNASPDDCASASIRIDRAGCASGCAWSSPSAGRRTGSSDRRGSGNRSGCPDRCLDTATGATYLDSHPHSRATDSGFGGLRSSRTSSAPGREGTLGYGIYICLSEFDVAVLSHDCAASCTSP
jgi:hypothetical protein